MTDWIIHIDQALFQWINTGIQNELFDWLLPILREKIIWTPLYIFLIGFLVLNFKKKGYFIVIFCLIVVLMSDFFSSQVIKKSIQRVRPCHVIEHFDQFELRARCGSGYSFTSSHACNHFSIATFLFLTLTFIKKRWRYLFSVWAGIISISQVYVGVHYPVDILCGAILGTCIGWIVYVFYSRFFIHT